MLSEFSWPATLTKQPLFPTLFFFIGIKMTHKVKKVPVHETQLDLWQDLPSSYSQYNKDTCSLIGFTTQ